MESQNDYELKHNFLLTMVNKDFGSIGQCVTCRTRCTWQGMNREGCEDFEGRDD